MAAFRFSTRARRRAPSPIRELLPLMRLEGMISLGGGYPNPKTFAFSRVAVELGEGEEPLVLEGEALRAASQYAQTDGVPALLDQLWSWQHAKDGVELEEGGILVLNGSQEGLYILADILLDEGEPIVLSEPAYPGALSAFRSFTDRFVSIPVDGEGLRVDLLEAGLRSGELPRPRFVYCVPNGHNPAGVTLSRARRQHLAEVARTFDLLLLEDDPYQLLGLDSDVLLPTLQSLCPERVVRLDSFSKILCPGLRLGYASGPPAIVRQMVLFKQASNLHTSSFVQAVLTSLLAREGATGLRHRVKSNVSLYRRNRDAMVAAAERHLPKGVTFSVPTAGMFVWFQLPDVCDAARMLEEDGRTLKVLLVPGSAFSTSGGCTSSMRASFSLVDEATIEEGMRRFGVMIRRELERSATHVLEE